MCTDIQFRLLIQEHIQRKWKTNKEAPKSRHSIEKNTLLRKITSLFIFASGGWHRVNVSSTQNPLLSEHWHWYHLDLYLFLTEIAPSAVDVTCNLPGRKCRLRREKILEWAKSSPFLIFFRKHSVLCHISSSLAYTSDGIGKFYREELSIKANGRSEIQR